MEKENPKKIKLNVTREEDNLQTNIYYVCDKNIIISQLNITINYDENNIEEEDFGITNEWNINDINKQVENEDNNKKKKYINIKISYSDELNDLYFNNVINNLYNYIFENKLNNLYINKNHTWFININIYIYEYTPYIYDHICNVINVHLSLLLIPFCFYDFDSKWYRCVENYDEFLKLINRNNNIKENNVKTNSETLEDDKNKIIQESHDTSTEDMILVLDKHEQNKNIIINQLNNTNFDLFVQVKNIKTTGMFKRLFINFIPIIKTANVNDQFIYIVKFVDYSSFFLSTQNNADNNSIYNEIVQNHHFVNFNKYTFSNSLENNPNDTENKFEFVDNYYILFNGNHSNIDEAGILSDSKSTIRFYYDFITQFCTNYFTENFLK
ncbi:conserved Plasmodium protein, unknown function [Plasmodium vinckei vinckei]|uniref:Uncharacterized protein n=1 Tax=Plasmodium vinckei vinckei TaxID=54757 RepID=A0A449BV69_PLAVN|nr:conserved Plasmodium protein, unknown function [Plasmodium vinckei vinckei]KEG02628.1 hypothetical protein YYE_02457 [Plasmodium vinckei vinckei]VEV57377.1 conserved Plasmodium protein, unknown function [Plasmodium vinckei vinckei]